MNALKKNEASPKGVYKKIMGNIEFMQPYLTDQEIFNPNSIKFKNFLIQAFAHLHVDFHYLSFLNKEDVDQEILKVAGILQILPVNSNKKNSNLFDNMSETEIHKFWMRFFSLFKNKKTDEFSVDSILSDNLKSKTDFLSDITSTLNYLNYDFPIVNLKTLTSVNINKEMESWGGKLPNCDIEIDNSICCNYEPQPINNEDVEKLIIDLKHIVANYNSNQKVSDESKSDYCDFFSSFIILTKDLLKYKNDLSVIDSSFLDELHCKILSINEYDSSANLYFIKRCNNLIRTLKSKLRTMD